MEWRVSRNESWEFRWRVLTLPTQPIKTSITKREEAGFAEHPSRRSQACADGISDLHKKAGSIPIGRMRKL